MSPDAILDRIKTLKAINKRLKGELRGILSVSKLAIAEIDEDGLSQDTCESMASVLRSAESDALKLFVGLKSIHQSMNRYIPDGGGEGNKEWPPA